jgi:hypothetical protein
LEYRVSCYFDFVHIFFEFDVMPNHRMERKARAHAFYQSSGGIGTRLK